MWRVCPPPPPFQTAGVSDPNACHTVTTPCCRWERRGRPDTRASTPRERGKSRRSLRKKKNSLVFLPTHTQVDEGADATASAATLKELVADLTAGKGHSLSEVVPGKTAVLTVA